MYFVVLSVIVYYILENFHIKNSSERSYIRPCVCTCALANMRTHTRTNTCKEIAFTNAPTYIHTQLTIYLISQSRDIMKINFQRSLV